jgi:hypothetical protein
MILTRDKYLEFKRTGQIGNIIYYYYISECNKKGVIPFETHKFFTLFNIWEGKDIAAEAVVSHYDIEFDIRTLSDAQGKVIKYL